MQKNKQDGAEGLASIGIDMPVLDQSEEHQLQLQLQQQHDQVKQEHSDHEHQEQQHQDHLVEGDDQNSQSGGPVSMPSLDDDAESSQPSTNDQVPMDLDEMQNAAESGQIKFILNENGQLIQLDNHILTTDADGNQILVQGTDSEHLQQLLQSVGVLQAGDGDGEQTFQMIQGENNQMILVQGDNNEAQLIDASMLNEDGHLVIQQHGDGELPEGMHVVNEDGVQVPVSIAFAQHMDESSADHHHHQQQQQHEQHEQHEQQEFAQQMEEENAELGAAENAQEHSEQQQQDPLDQKTDAEHQEQPSDETHPADSDEQNIKLEESSQDGEEQQLQVSSADSDVTTVTTSTTTPVTSTTGGEVYFNLDELMNQPDQKVSFFF